MAGMRLELSNDVSAFERLASGLEEFGAERELSPDVISEINLVIEELVSNTFNYGAEDGRDPATVKAIVEMDMADGEVSLRIEDNARPFDPFQIETPDLDVPLEERETGGLGVHLVRTLMDHVEYEREGDRNVLRMRKRIGG